MIFMSLVVAFNLDDYAILATDKRGVLNYIDENKENHVLSTDDTYQKKLRKKKIPFWLLCLSRRLPHNGMFLCRMYDADTKKKKFRSNLRKYLP